jgi:hydrogenase maturation factor
MRDLTGTIIEIVVEGGITYALLSRGGLKEKVSLTLVMDARVGDEVHVESGVAMATTPRRSTVLVG